MTCKNCGDKNERKLISLIRIELNDIKNLLKNGKIDKKKYVSMVKAVLNKYNIRI